MTASKYHAKRCTVGGEKFDSKLEASRFCRLKLMERAGAISHLMRQVRFPLLVGGVKIGDYVADFVYLDGSHAQVIEDAKGVLTPLCRWKLKHMEAQGNPVALWPPRKTKTRDGNAAPC